MASNNTAFNKREQYELRRQVLVREAARVFNERGAANASLDDIAGNLNITKAALYYYFKSKDELLFECFSSAFDIADEAVAYAETHGRNGRERVELYIRRHVEIGLSEEFPTITARVEELVSPEYREIITERRRSRRDKLRRFIQDGIEDGSIIDCDPRIAIVMINGIILWLFRIYRAKGPYSPKEIADQIVRILIGGLATKPKRRSKGRIT